MAKIIIEYEEYKELLKYQQANAFKKCTLNKKKWYQFWK